jgi:proline iminopeptidase
MAINDQNEEGRTMSEKQLPHWIADHLQRYLATDGADGHLWDASGPGGHKDTPTLLLTTIGRRSGKALMLPLIYGRSDDGGYVVVASKGGAPEHPAWFLNLEANPDVNVQVLAKKFRAKARVTAGDERAALWKQLVGVYPPYTEYQQNTQRQIPVVVLDEV